MASKDDVEGFDVVRDCPKNMLNGPCGGMENGLCEVEGPCVWVKIFAKLSSEGRLDDFCKVRLPRIK